MNDEKEQLQNQQINRAEIASRLMAAFITSGWNDYDYAATHAIYAADSLIEKLNLSSEELMWKGKK